MKKVWMTIVTVMLIAVIAMVFVSCAAGETIKNNSFDDFGKIDTPTENDVPVGWKKVEDTGSATRKLKYTQIQPGSDQEQSGLVTKRYVTFEVKSTKGSLSLQQTVKLKKNVKYELSFSINIPSSISPANSKGFGAFVGFAEDLDFRDANYTVKTSGWLKKTVYFTAEESGDYTLTVGIGRNQTGGATGSADFDNITLKQVDEFPINVTAGTVTGGNRETQTGIIAYVVIMLLLTVILMCGAYVLHLRYKQMNEFGIKEKSKWISPFMNFIYVMTGVFLVRFIMVALTGGMSNEMTEMGNIALKISDKGINNVFANSNTTLPTGMLYWLSLTGVIANAANLSATSVGMSILLRLPNVLGDIICCYLLFAIVSKIRSQQEGVVAAAIYGLVPAFFSLTALWGQSMSVTLAFLLGMMYFMIEKKYIGVSLTFLGALMFSNYVLILAPVAVLYAIFFAWKDESLKARISIPLGAIGVVLGIFLLSLPFTINYVQDGEVLKVFAKMADDFTANPYTTNSVFNIYGMVGLGGAVAPLATKIVTGIIMLIFIGLGIWFYLSGRNRVDFVLLSALSLILYSVFGIGARIEVMVMGIVLLLLYAYLREDRRVHRAVNIYSALAMFNIGIILIESDVLASGNVLDKLLGNNWALILGSILTILNTAYLLYIAYQIMMKDKLNYASPIDSFSEYFKDFKASALSLIGKKAK